MKPFVAMIALFALPLAACTEAQLKGFGVETGAAEPAAPTQPRGPVASPLEVPIETGRVPSALAVNADSETLNTSAFIAAGNEPFWRVDITGNTAVYKTPQNPAGQKVSVNRLVFTEGVEYVGTLGGRVFTVNIRGADCSDSMSGHTYPMTATLNVRGASHRGCAGPARQVDAD